MNIPLDRLYHYIESVARDVYGDTVIYRFYPHGSKNIEDLEAIRYKTLEDDIYCPHIVCYDQEPLNYDLYKNTTIRLGKEFGNVDPLLLPKRNLKIKLGNVYDKWLLLHSEKSSPEVLRYQEDQFFPVYYWSHAIIARDWFRYAPYVKFNKDIKKTFLIYNRAWAGTREYRLKFIDKLIDSNLLDYCKTNFNPYDNNQHYKSYKFSNNHWVPAHTLEEYLTPTDAPSSYSAEFDIDDYNSTEFEIVLETLFDDQRQQLTEKVLRPIACKQPFIVVSTPGVLKYLQNYGFQTFAEIFDESYDLIQDPIKRMENIVETMKKITMWSPDYKQTQMKKIEKIVEFNQRHFFSEEFFNKIIFELKNNLKTGFEHIESTTIGSQYRDTKVRNIPGMRAYRKTKLSYEGRKKVLQTIKEYRKRNRKIVK